MILGSVDAVVNNRVAGWAFNQDDPDEHLEIVIARGDKVIVTGLANALRKDLDELGSGDHAFSIDIGESTNVLGLTVTARSAKHGSTTLPTPAERSAQATMKRYERSQAAVERRLLEIVDMVDTLRHGDDEQLSQRMAEIESRLDASEVFFVRFDEMMRKIIESKKKPRRWFGIF